MHRVTHSVATAPDDAPPLRRASGWVREAPDPEVRAPRGLVHRAAITRRPRASAPQTGTMGWPEFYAMAVHGIVDLGMGRAAGLSENTIRRRARTDGWVPEHPGAWRLPAHPSTPRSALAAAVRRAGPGAAADRHTTFALHGLVSSFPTRHQLLLPHDRRHRRLDGLDVRRSRVVPASHLEEVDGIVTVTVARALVDVARDLRTDALRSLALAAQRERLASEQDLRSVLDVLTCAPGRSRAVQVVRDLRLDGSESGFEFTTRDRIETAGLRPDPEQPTVTVSGRRRRIDIAWLDLRVGVECQGYRDHVGRRALDRDAARVNELVAHGDWLLLQVTPSMLHDGWPAFLASLCACLRRRADDLGLPQPEGADRH